MNLSNNNSRKNSIKNSVSTSKKTISKLAQGLSDQEKFVLIKEILGMKPEEGLPASAFRCRLSGLEVLTKYLKENQNKSINQISDILSRKRSTIYNTYRIAKRKMPSALNISEDIIIPFNIFTDRKYSILESIVVYLRDDSHKSFSEISRLIAKKESTLRTVYWRYKKKWMKH